MWKTRLQDEEGGRESGFCYMTISSIPYWIWDFKKLKIQFKILQYKTKKIPSPSQIYHLCIIYSYQRSDQTNQQAKQALPHRTLGGLLSSLPSYCGVWGFVMVFSCVIKYILYAHLVCMKGMITGYLWERGSRSLEVRGGRETCLTIFHFVPSKAFIMYIHF